MSVSADGQWWYLVSVTGAPLSPLATSACQGKSAPRLQTAGLTRFSLQHMPRGAVKCERSALSQTRSLARVNTRYTRELALMICTSACPSPTTRTALSDLSVVFVQGLGKNTLRDTWCSGRWLGWVRFDILFNGGGGEYRHRG